MAERAIGCWTLRDFRRNAGKTPENAVFYADSVLTAAASSANTPPETRRQALAALLARHILSPGRTGGEEAGLLLDRWLGAEEVARFAELCLLCERRERAMNLDKLFGQFFREGAGQRLSEADRAAIVTACRQILGADGFIPVFSGSNAFLVPFHFTTRQPGAPAKVTDSRGTKLDEWSGYLAELEEIRDDVCVDARAEGVSFTGASLMLPLTMAWWRHEGAENFPPYPILRLYATGSLHGGRLGAVDTKEKAGKVAEVESALFVHPVAGAAERSGELPIGTPADRCREWIARWAERMTVCSPDYAKKRLSEYDTRIRTAKGENWTEVREALKNLTQGLDRELDPGECLLGLMLRSNAACHAGDTEEAARLNEEATRLADGLPGHGADLLRLRIEQLVFILDQEDFGTLRRISDALEADLEAFTKQSGETETVRDLRMRFHGSMGQVLAAMALAETDKALADAAKEHIERACCFAVSLWKAAEDEKAPADQRFDALSNVVQDANYLVMWAALHDFGSLKTSAASAARRAERLCNFDLSGDPRGTGRCLTNAGYRERFRLMGWYRALLRGDAAADGNWHPDESVLRELKAEFWTRALCGKYLGAMEAARGRAECARKRFEEAEAQRTKPKPEGIPFSECTTGVLGVIRMTLLAEAFRSLRGGPEAEFAEECRKKALGLLDAPENRGWGKEAWRAFLLDPDGAPFPGLSYWY